jgi:CRP-like cAMP-binding protein
MTNIIFKHLTPEKVFTQKDAIDKQEVFAYFIEFLKHFGSFTEEDLQGLDQYWTIKVMKKNEMPFKEGEDIKELGFIVRGAVKLYKEFEKGQQVLALLTDANFCTMKKTFCRNLPAEYNAVCTETTIFLTIDHQKMAELIKDRPVFQIYFTQQNENIIHFLEHRLTSLQVMTAQERYEDMLDKFPDLLARFTLSDIANYLGMKGETLSRIRGVLSKKDIKIAS